MCIIQLKPQLEKLLNLPDDSLTKEIKLTQDLMEMFITYQIPSDLLSYDGDNTVRAQTASTPTYFATNNSYSEHCFHPNLLATNNSYSEHSLPPTLLSAILSRLAPHNGDAKDSWPWAIGHICHGP